MTAASESDATSFALGGRELLVLLEGLVLVGTKIVLLAVESDVPDAPRRPIPRLRKLLHG